jgi:RecA-family ATPase
LTSPTSRNSFAKLLFDADPSVEKGEWDIIMEQLCESVLTDYRAGSPEMLLTGDAEEEEAEWIIDPLVQVENPTLIFGIGSAGKSLFAQYLAVLVDAGYEHGGLKVQRKNVLYLVSHMVQVDDLWYSR